MSSLPETKPSLPADESKPAYLESRAIPDDDDQQFLLFFIMGTYFGPDLKGQKHLKSALQRKAENLQPYTFDQLAGSHIKRVEVERVYYYILRNADQSLRAKLLFLRQFVEGTRKDFNGNYLQFTHLFPPKLHPHTRIRKQFKVIKNIVFINNPEISYMRPEDIERFKRLTGLQDFFLSRNASTLHMPVATSTDIKEVETNQGLTHLRSNFNSPEILDGPELVTGIPATGQVGPLVGLMDIGECEDSYLFRVSLPGVKRDEREFSCEVEDNDKVLIRGVTTTGEKKVYRYSQVFEMQTRNLCPPGHFSVSFQLPGPVDPLQFAGNFGIDGILEGIVMKSQMKS